MKIPFNLIRYPFHSIRSTFVHPISLLFFFVAPVMGFFRVDVLTHQIIFMGTAYPFAFQTIMWLPIGFYGAVLLIGLASALIGRIFCGWLCPHNILVELTRPIRAMVGREPYPPWFLRLKKKMPLSRSIEIALSLGLSLLLTTVFAILLTTWLLSPDWLWTQYVSGQPHIALVFGHGLLVLIGLFLIYAGHDFCRTCCPYGMAQSISAYQAGKWRPLEILFHGEKATQCKTCTACQQVCPVNIDPRETGQLKVGQFDGCFNCGECVDACQVVFKEKATPALLSFGFLNLKKIS